MGDLVSRIDDSVTLEVWAPNEGRSTYTIALVDNDGEPEEQCVCIHAATLDELQDAAAHVYNETLRQINELRAQAAQ